MDPESWGVYKLDARKALMQRGGNDHHLAVNQTYTLAGDRYVICRSLLYWLPRLTFCAGLADSDLFTKLPHL